MKTKFLIKATLAMFAFASCAESSYVGDQDVLNERATISFNMSTPAQTRADKTGSDAAGDLSNQFIVYGEKNETSYTAPAAGNLVFQNYKVTYGNNTAYTTTSNTKDWEYVGNVWTSAEQAKITTSTTDAQTIKYWDYGASSYTFTAVSALPTDISSGNISITKTTESNATLGQYGKGYIVNIANAAADLSKLYFSDRLNIAKSNGTDRNATNAYGGNVTLKFRNLLSHVRVGMYETISGYDISAIKFYVFNPNDGQLSANALDGDSHDCFGAKCPNIAQATYTGDITVIYGGAGSSIENQPIVSVSGTPAQNLILGTNINAINTTTVLKTAANNPTWDKSDGSYTAVMPQKDNNVNLQLKCDYTLYNSITGETIKVNGATAVVPAQYLQWKPNYKYTYLFKISENTNGSTGEDVVGLYPITFDAVEVVAEDGQAEYITTVSEPSITTFGVVLDNSDKFKNYVTGKNDYQLPGGTDKLDIYAAIEDNSTLVTPVLSSNVKIYLVDHKAGATSAEKEAFPITEASLAEAIAETGASAEMITYTDITGDASTNFSTAPSAVTTVPGEDGVDITGTHAVKLTGVKCPSGTKYFAVEYITGKWNNDGGKFYTSEEYAAAGTLYTDPDCADAHAASSWENASTTYYKRTTTKNVYKIIKVVAAP